MKKIVSRGRVLGKNSSEFARMLEGSEGTKTFTLKSGRQAKFLLTVVLSGEIESRRSLTRQLTAAISLCSPLSR